MNLKGSSKKKYLILGTIGSGILAVSIVTPIVILNSKNDKVKEDEDINKIAKILQAKTTKEKIIELASNASGKIVANNQNKIIEKIKTLIGKANLKDVKIEISMQTDNNISINAQKIIIKLTKNEISKEVKDFLVKKKNAIDEEIESIKKVLDAKTGKDLIITLSSNSSGKIIGKVANKNAIEKKLKILVDPLNTNGESNHSSLKGTKISISMNVDAPISTSVQNIIVSISKSGGKTLKTTSIFQVKRYFTNAEKITNYFANSAKKSITITGGGALDTEPKILVAIKKHLANDESALWTNQLQSLITTHSSETKTSIVKDAPAVTYSIAYNDDSGNTQKVDLTINHLSTNAEKITNYFANSAKKSITITGEETLDTEPKILAAIKKHLANDESALWTSQLQSLITTHSFETKTSIVKDAPVVIYSIAYNDDSGNIQKVDLTINHLSTNAEKITNYFANSAKKRITITGEETLDTEPKILAAIKKHLANDESALWTNQLQSLITAHSSETKTSIVKDAPVVTYSIAYNDDSGNTQKVDLTINHLSTNAEKITNYFANGAKKSITITGGGALDTEPKILVAIKKHLANDESALWTNQLQSLITTHSSETKTSIVKDAPAVTYSIAYNDDSGNTQKVDLTINHLSTNAEKITNYFANSAKKSITITGEETLDTEPKILVAIKKHLANDESALWNSQLQSLITTHSSETKTSIVKDAPVVTYSIAYNDDSGNTQKVDLTINHLSTNAKKITNYFANSAKKTFTIVGGEALDTEPKILAAIKKHLANDESALWTNQLQSLITTHSSETKTSIVKDAPVVTYSIAYNDDSGNTQKVDLTINHVSTNAEKITNYFANSAKKRITITGEEALDTEPKILAAIKKHLANDESALWNSQLQSLITTHSSETKTSIVKDAPAVIYSIAYNDDLGNTQKVDLAINHLSTNAEKITNYFANSAKKRITITGEEALDTEPKILAAIKKHLANDESALWTNQLQSLITAHSSETKTSIVKDAPAVIYSIAYNDDSGNTQKVDLTINHVSTNAEKITNYFANSAKKSITIIGGGALDTEPKILAAIKKHLANDESALWTNQLQSLITTHSSETKTSIVKDAPAVIYSIAYNDDSGNTQKVDLTINHLSTNAEKITNYFANSAKKSIMITDEETLDTEPKILAAIKKHLANDESALWTNQLQSLITTHSSETKTSIVKDAPAAIYSIAYNDDLGNTQKVDLTINYLSTNAEKITNYFANSAKKSITITSEEALDTKAKILAAIKKHLAIDDGVLWTNEIQNLITTHSSETKTSIVKNALAVTYSIAYNDDSGNIQKVDLLIDQIRYTNPEKITNYFANIAKKTFTIIDRNDLDTKAKILAAIKKHLAIDDGAVWTSELQSLITTHSSETENSITKGGPAITYSIAYNDDLNNAQKVDLTINYGYTNAEKITNYFTNNAKKSITIFGGETLDTKAKILAAIKTHLTSDDPDLWTNTVQSLITVDNDETINQIVKEDYNEASFSIAYNDDDGITQNVELRIKHLRTKIENENIVNSLYDHYNNKWNTREKALVVALGYTYEWSGQEIKKAVNDATQNIYVQDKVGFDVNGFFVHPRDKTPSFITNVHDEEDLWEFELFNTPRKFRVVFYSGKNEQVFYKTMNIFIKAIQG